MFVTKDLNMDGVCEWLDPQMLDIWLVDAPMKNNVEDAMNAIFFLLWFENHNLWLQHLHIILFLFKYQYFLYDVGSPLRLL